MTKLPKAESPQMRSRSKFGNIQTAVGDKVFGSKKEAKRYGELLLMERACLIRELMTQVPYELIPKQQGERNCVYIADFVYKQRETGILHVEDTKGFRTKDYIIKRKLMLWLKGIRIEEL